MNNSGSEVKFAKEDWNRFNLRRDVRTFSTPPIRVSRLKISFYDNNDDNDDDNDDDDDGGPRSGTWIGKESDFKIGNNSGNEVAPNVRIRIVFENRTAIDMDSGISQCNS
ncbi:hypothetical protein EVAR_22097_1 [Eumeta japonica]|uniref:Uncharacterized protein n=1 Tax=Eumeta variegata TaxID=151549 RepID=A0A4C1UUJ7_EUMVA|nr:hypothetical protein EVAR_22097_1 [Eumeta japonica]